MSKELLEGMVFAFNHAEHLNDEEAMRAALLWLSKNVTKEMAGTMNRMILSEQNSDPYEVIGAVLRRAAEL